MAAFKVKVTVVSIIMNRICVRCISLKIVPNIDRKRYSAFIIVIYMATLGVNIAFAQSTKGEMPPQVQKLYAEAKTASQHGQIDLAIQKYSAMLELAPDLAPAYNNLGMLYFNKHDYLHASQVLERGLKLNHNMPTAAAMLGLSYANLGKNAKAEPLLDRASKANPQDSSLEMMLIHVLISLKRFDEAASHLRDFVNRNPKDQEAWYLLGKTYLQLYEDALERINQIDPNSVIAHEISGEIDESMHNYDGALVEYKKAVNMAPQKPGTHLHMGNVYWVMGKWESAESEFRAELANDPTNCSVRWKLADATLEAGGPPKEALSELNRAIDRCPDLMQAHVDRARAFIRLNKPNDALSDLLMAEKDSPNEPSIHFLLATAYRAQGDMAKAQQERHVYEHLQSAAHESMTQEATDITAIKKQAN